MRQVVAYKRLKTKKIPGQESGHGRLQEVSFTKVSNCEALTGTVLVFRLGGRLCEAVAYEKWSHMEVGLYYI